MQYIETARAKGLSENQTLYRHAVPNALHPLVMFQGIALPYMLMGELEAAIVLSIPTAGPLLIESIQRQDTYTTAAILFCLTVILIIGIIYVLVTFLLRSRLNENSKIITKNQTGLIKTLQEGLGGIKEVILSSMQPFFVKEFSRSYSKLNTSLVFNNFFAQSPKVVIETLSILLLLSFFYCCSV